MRLKFNWPHQIKLPCALLARATTKNTACLYVLPSDRWRMSGAAKPELEALEFRLNEILRLASIAGLKLVFSLNGRSRMSTIV